MSSVIEDLKKWGPDGTGAPLNLSEAEQYTRQLATTHYENFPVVTKVVPRDLRQHFANVYGFCRWADDLGDETGSPEESLRLLSWWKSELHRCYEGQVSHPIYVALKPTIEKFSIPIDPFEDLISAFEQDQSVQNYDTFSQLTDYCRRSANPVGRIVLHLIGSPHPENLRCSDSICTGLQLANFWQDVSRDHDIGRVYLPREDRERFGYSDEDLEDKRFTPEFRQLLEFEVDRTRELFREGEPLVRSLSGRWRIVVDLFSRGGQMVLDEITRLDYNVWRQRPVITKSHAAKALLKSIVSSVIGRR
ncbi:squalene synthase HpnC [Thalassoglobus sp. JC818]|uniref:squalene synthase HpnC n=1 Tax=Thalassoglobus sp. JC818 TaxID=3232136 RepID=UPI00345A3F36